MTVIPFPPGQFDLALVDPPWRWLTRTPKGDGKAPPYARMSREELLAFPIGDVLAKDAMVALWTIDSHIPQALELFTAWGLKFSTVGYYWAKTTKTGKWHIGTGKLTRANPEQMWLGRRGKGLPVVDHGVRRLIVSQLREHSRKPDEAREGLERLFGDTAGGRPIRRIEMFARERFKGWTPWGLGVPPNGEPGLF